MGIRLDWDVESERTSLRDSEDETTRKNRRQLRMRILFSIGFFVSVCGVLYGVITWRLRTVENELRRALQDTVQAEVTALRLGDRTAFLNIQRSAGDSWTIQQERLFNTYQELKLQNNLELTGQVLSVDIDGTRGRVQVQEIIDGVPYVQTWFYWRYGDGEGWRHVPPDYTFWGNLHVDESTYLSVRYRDVDEQIGTILFEDMNRWLDLGCQVVVCTDSLQISVDVTPQQGLDLTWNEANPWLLQVPSPYISRTRLDRPFDIQMQLKAAYLVADRLVVQSLGTVQPANSTDAYFLYDAIVRWLVGEFVQMDTESYLIDSYVTQYGTANMPAILDEIRRGSDIRVLAQMANAEHIGQLAVDWRDYLTWRLSLESVFHLNRDQVNYVGLYDTLLPEATNLAFTRFEQPVLAWNPTVIAIQPEMQADNVLGLRVIARDEQNQLEQAILFRLSDGLWKRAN